MNDYQLLTEDDYANFPAGDEECFLELEATCRRNLHREFDRLDRGENAEPLWESYISIVSSAAAECGIEGVSDAGKGETYDRFREFRSNVDAAVTRLRLRGRHQGGRHSVQLTTKTRAQIEIQVSHLRHMIEDSNLPKHRKKALLEKLDELSQEIANNRRLSFARVMAILAPVAFMLGGTVGLAANLTTIAADSPNAVTNILALISQDKETEDNARLRLEAPPKALPAPPSSKPTLSAPGGYGSSGGWGRHKAPPDLDDDIPF
jgi:uncharacterized protein (UPF0147 family)